MNHASDIFMKKAVVLLSGGIDSSTTLAVARSKSYELYTLSFDYNQRHREELKAAKRVAAALGVKKHLILKFDLREIGGSALTDEIEVPKHMTGKHGDTETRRFCTDSPIHPLTHSPIPATYVPARNTIFLSFALAWAEVLEAEDIFIGANAVDYSGYPDCRPEYLKAFETMANLATKASVEGLIRFRINAPLINMTKAETIRKGLELGLDYSLTWSCYDPQPASAGVQSSENSKRRTLNSRTNNYVPCGRCDSCLFRKKGFKEVGIKDPLIKSTQNS